MEALVPEIIVWLFAGGSAALLYRLLKKPWAAWCLSVVLLAACTFLLGRGLFVGPWVAGAVTSSLEARRTGWDIRLRRTAAASFVAVAAALSLVFVATYNVGRADPVHAAWSLRGTDLQQMGFVVLAGGKEEELSSFAEFFRHVEEAAGELHEQSREPAREADARPVSANPFPGLLSGEYYGRLEFWPPEAPPEEVPLLWDMETYKGQFSVLFLDGKCRTCSWWELEDTIERLRGYGPSDEPQATDFQRSDQ